MKKILFLWFILGAIYINLEIITRNYTDRVMLLVGGICGVLIGLINQHPKFYKAKIIFQSIIGTLIVLSVEFISGCILNLWLGLNIWDYSHLPLDVMGQICMLYGVIWFLLMPFAIWLEDTMRWLIYQWDLYFYRYSEPPLYDPYTLKSIYIDCFTGK